MSNDVVAQRLFEAIEAGDVGAVRALYSPDAVVWHNTDSIEQTAEQNLATLAWVVANLAERRYEDVSRGSPSAGSCSSTRCAGPRPTAPVRSFRLASWRPARTG